MELSQNKGVESWLSHPLLSDWMGGYSPQREEHKQLPANRSEHGVSQEWQIETVGQGERLEGLWRPGMPFQGILTFSGGR